MDNPVKKGKFTKVLKCRKNVLHSYNWNKEKKDSFFEIRKITSTMWILKEFMEIMLPGGTILLLKYACLQNIIHQTPRIQTMFLIQTFISTQWKAAIMINQQSYHFEIRLGNWLYKDIWGLIQCSIMINILNENNELLWIPTFIVLF